jgi:dienelactone hydrolase
MMTTLLRNALLKSLAIICLANPPVVAQDASAGESRVVVRNEGWELVGDLRLPSDTGPVPAVLMLNHAARDRTVYADMARFLAQRGVASLRLDLRGHGESVNLGRFVPGEHERDPLIWNAEADVQAAIDYLRADPRIDGSRLGSVGASYSGEEMAEAGRLHGYAQAYVALSPGSFSDESVRGIDASGVDWLFVVSRDERFLGEITAAVQEESRTVELLILPGTEHGVRILLTHRDTSERIAVWLAQRLRR